MSKHLIITDEWRVHSHVIEHKEVHVYQNDANDDRPSNTVTRLQGVFGDLDDLPLTDLPENQDSRLGLGDKYDKETFTIEPCNSSNDSLTKKPSKTKSLTVLGSKLSLSGKNFLGNKQTLTTKLLGTIKPPGDNSHKNPTETKKHTLNKKDLHDDKPEAIKPAKKADKQDLELKSEPKPPMKPSKTKKKDNGNLKD